MTTIFNRRNYKGPGVYIGRPSRWGNPYVIGRHGTREEVIELYEAWFKRRLKDEGFRREVEKLRGENLICWCAPLPCHGDVIRRYLRGE